MKDPLSRRGIVGLAAVLLGGGAKAIEAEASDLLREKLLGGDACQPPQPYTGSGLDGPSGPAFDPIKFAARLAASGAQKRSVAHREHLHTLRAMSPAARRCYARSSNGEARKLWRKMEVVMGYRSPEELFHPDPDDF